MAIWRPLDPPKKLGIRGTNVAVDWDLYEGCGTCIKVWRETLGHPTSERKSFPAREDECMQCLTCETQCPVQAIKITCPNQVSNN
ncbi:ferredoxin family protein [Candidatus Bathyarchaeota archaeon]|nr:ferredoxin family protein [Candidatus Bathyarchaeota archaeon]